MSGPPASGWWLASDGRWYPPEAWAPVPPAAPAAPHPPDRPGGREPRRAIGVLVGLIVVLAVVAVALPLVAEVHHPGATRRPTGAPIVPFRRINVPTYPPGCPSAAPGHPASTRVPMDVVRSGTFIWEFVPVCIDGRGPYPFILDTGAAGSLVDAALARAIGLPTTARADRARGVNDCSAAASVSRIAAWALGPVPLAAQEVQTVAVPFFGARDAPAGLLGSDVLARFGTVRLDFSSHVLLLGGREGPVGADRSVAGTGDRSAVPRALTGTGPFTPVPMSVVVRDGYVRPLVDVHIAGSDHPFVLDTGAGTSAVDREFAAVVSLAGTGRREVISGVACTIAVPIVGSGRWAIGPVRLGPRPMPDVSLGPIGASGLLGSDELTRFGWIVLDYRRGELLLGPGR